jgi:hypothetical protein
MVKDTPWQETLCHWYNATDYAVNLSNCPVVAYSGELDKQKAAADTMARAMKEEGLELIHVIGPKTEHKYEPEAKKEVARRVDEFAAKGRDRTRRIASPRDAAGQRDEMDYSRRAREALGTGHGRCRAGRQPDQGQHQECFGTDLTLKQVDIDGQRVTGSALLKKADGKDLRPCRR